MRKRVWIVFLVTTVLLSSLAIASHLQYRQSCGGNLAHCVSSLACGTILHSSHNIPGVAVGQSYCLYRIFPFAGSLEFPSVTCAADAQCGSDAVQGICRQAPANYFDSLAIGQYRCFALNLPTLAIPDRSSPVCYFDQQCTSGVCKLNQWTHNVNRDARDIRACHSNLLSDGVECFYDDQCTSGQGSQAVTDACQNAVLHDLTNPGSWSASVATGRCRNTAQPVGIRMGGSFGGFQAIDPATSQLYPIRNVVARGDIGDISWDITDPSRYGVSACTGSDSDVAGNQNIIRNAIGSGISWAGGRTLTTRQDGTSVGNFPQGIFHHTTTLTLVCQSNNIPGVGVLTSTATLQVDVDYCRSIPGVQTIDTDQDTFGDICDLCPNNPNIQVNPGDADIGPRPGYYRNGAPVSSITGDTDSDNDGVGNSCDNCPNLANGPDLTQINGGRNNQLDTDGDNIGDVCDLCIRDPQNDQDNDGFCNGIGFLSPKVGQSDNCPDVANPTQTDADGDRFGDACDMCPDDSNNDPDGDGVCLSARFNPLAVGGRDNCPLVSNSPSDCDNNPNTPNIQCDRDNDGLGDACDTVDNRPDTDRDGFRDPDDNCPQVSNGVFIPNVQNDCHVSFAGLETTYCNQLDYDNDRIGNACDPCLYDPNNDADRDGFCVGGHVQLQTTGSNRPNDNCPTVANPTQADTDNDRVGDACDLSTCGNLDSTSGIFPADVLAVVRHIFQNPSLNANLVSQANVHPTPGIDYNDVIALVNRIVDPNNPATALTCS